MNDRTIDIVVYALLLLLPLSALVARRPPLRQTLRARFTGAVILGGGLLHRPNRHPLPDLGGLVSDQAVVGEETRIRMSPDGHFWARVTINGVGRRMLIDSGATVTAISDDTAREAGIDTDGRSRFPVLLRTANGTVAAKRGTADQVQLGSVRTEKLGVVGVRRGGRDRDELPVAARIVARGGTHADHDAQGCRMILHNMYYQFSGSAG